MRDELNTRTLHESASLHGQKSSCIRCRRFLLKYKTCRRSAKLSQTNSGGERHVESN
jgi:hypothetical protein